MESLIRVSDAEEPERRASMLCKSRAIAFHSATRYENSFVGNVLGSGGISGVCPSRGAA